MSRWSRRRGRETKTEAARRAACPRAEPPYAHAVPGHRRLDGKPCRRLPSGDLPKALSPVGGPYTDAAPANANVSSNHESMCKTCLRCAKARRCATT